MRIGIDGRELLGERSVVGRYLSELLSQWIVCPHASEHEFLIYTPEQDSSLLGQDLPGRFDSTSQLQYISVPGISGTYWEQVQLRTVANSDRLDIFFAPAYSFPLAFQIPTVLTMHDVSFFAHTEWFSWREGYRRRWLAQASLRRARELNAVSQFTKDDH